MEDKNGGGKGLRGILLEAAPISILSEAADSGDVEFFKGGGSEVGGEATRYVGQAGTKAEVDELEMGPAIRDAGEGREGIGSLRGEVVEEVGAKRGGADGEAKDADALDAEGKVGKVGAVDKGVGIGGGGGRGGGPGWDMGPAVTNIDVEAQIGGPAGRNVVGGGEGG